MLLLFSCLGLVKQIWARPVDGIYILVAFTKPRCLNVAVIFQRLFPQTTLYFQEIYIYYLSIDLDSKVIEVSKRGTVSRVVPTRSV